MARPRSKPSEWADTAEHIQASRLMDVTLLSGLKVTLRTVTLDELALDDAIPADLIEAAVLDSADLLLPQILEHVRHERVEEAQRLSRSSVLLADRVTAHALVRPEPTPELLEALDGFDKKMILEIAQRKRSTDATGKAVAAQRLDDFATFREDGHGTSGGGGGGADRDLAGAVG